MNMEKICINFFLAYQRLFEIFYMKIKPVVSELLDCSTGNAYSRRKALGVMGRNEPVLYNVKRRTQLKAASFHQMRLMSYHTTYNQLT